MDENFSKRMDDLVGALQSSIGVESSVLSNTACIDIADQDLKKFLENMSDAELSKFLSAIFYFFSYYKIIKHCEEAKDISDIWTNFVVVLLFGLIETVMTKHSYKECYSYLNARKNEGVDLSTLLDQWIAEHGSNEKIRVFFKKYVSETERKSILDAVKNDPKWKKVKTVNAFINKIINLRNDFVHSLSIENICAFNMRMVLGDTGAVAAGAGRLADSKVQWYPTISIDMLTHLILKGVYMKFDSTNALSRYLL